MLPQIFQITTSYGQQPNYLSLKDDFFCSGIYYWPEFSGYYRQLKQIAKQGTAGKIFGVYFKQLETDPTTKMQKKLSRCFIWATTFESWERSRRRCSSFSIASQTSWLRLMNAAFIASTLTGVWEKFGPGKSKATKRLSFFSSLDSMAQHNDVIN